MRVVEKTIKVTNWSVEMDAKEASVFLRLLEQRKEELDKFIAARLTMKDERDTYGEELDTIKNMLSSFEMHEGEEDL